MMGKDVKAQFTPQCAVSEKPRTTPYRGVPRKTVQSEEVRVLGANIRRERDARGLTQERLAELADLNTRTVQKIEAGDIKILVTYPHPNPRCARLRVAMLLG